MANVVSMNFHHYVYGCLNSIGYSSRLINSYLQAYFITIIAEAYIYDECDMCMRITIRPHNSKTIVKIAKYLLRNDKRLLCIRFSVLVDYLRLILSLLRIRTG